MVHERLEIERWKAEFPLLRLRQQAADFVAKRMVERPQEYPDEAAIRRHVDLMSPGGEELTSPHDIAVVELLRDELLASGRCPNLVSVPTDVFVFAAGESPQRAVTKFGGLPYWPSTEDWPRLDNGQPLSFIAQICFADSGDISGALPGDILLLFADAEAMNTCGYDGTFRFCWQRLSEKPLIAPGSVPEPDWGVFPCYGEIHRTRDFVFTPPCFESYHRWDQLASIEGTKIGGIPRFIQGEPDLPGRFLCSIGSIQPAFEQPYPWINRPEPITEFAEMHDPTFLMWGDMGSLYVYLEESGAIGWAVQNY